MQALNKMPLGQRREMSLPVPFDAKKEQFSASLSSERPCDRGDFYEVLVHAPDAVNLARANQGLPLLLNHDPAQQVGRVHNVRLVGSRLKGELSFSKSRADIEDDVRDGTRLEVSIGYTIDDVEFLPGDNAVRVTKWTLLEASLVPIPADPTVGIGRSFQQFPGQITRVTTRGTNKMKEENQINDASEIVALGRKHHMQGEAAEYLAAGKSLTEFRGLVLDRIGTSQPLQTPKEWGPEARDFNDLSSRVSFRDAILSLAGPKFIGRQNIDLGPIQEFTQEIERRSGKVSQGIHIPIQTRDVSFSASGGHLVGVEHRPNDFIDVLRARSAVMTLSPTMLHGLVGNVSIPRKSASATAYWIEGDGADDITESQPSFDNVPLTMKTVGGLTTFSHKMLKQGTPDMEMLIRQDLADLLAVEIDRAALQGTGQSNQPLGVVNTTGIELAEYGNGAFPSFDQIVDLEGRVASSNADFGSLAYLTTPALMAKMKTTTKVPNDASAGFIWESGRERGQGLMNGHNSYYTNNMPTGSVLYGNWQDLLIGFWGTIELMVDPYGTNFAKGSVSVRAMMDVDIAVRHPESFILLSEAAA